jgi:hypothetical protein
MPVAAVVTVIRAEAIAAAAPQQRRALSVELSEKRRKGRNDQRIKRAGRGMRAFRVETSARRETSEVDSSATCDSVRERWGVHGLSKLTTVLRDRGNAAVALVGALLKGKNAGARTTTRSDALHSFSSASRLDSIRFPVWTSSCS